MNDSTAGQPYRLFAESAGEQVRGKRPRLVAMGRRREGTAARPQGFCYIDAQKPILAKAIRGPACAGHGTRARNVLSMTYGVKSPSLNSRHPRRQSK